MSTVSKSTGSVTANSAQSGLFSARGNNERDGGADLSGGVGCEGGGGAEAGGAEDDGGVGVGGSLSAGGTAAAVGKDGGCSEDMPQDSTKNKRSERKKVSGVLSRSPLAPRQPFGD
ncbi:MAG: hypothetical protein LBT53_06645 [Puniceicoccales bacterium]|nr:hypothetical protein [Puniceicoccales bacterium]